MPETINLQVTVISIMLGGLSYFFFKTVNNFIEKKWGIIPTSKWDTFDIILDKIGDNFIKIAPKLKDLKGGYTPIPPPPEANNHMQEIVRLIADLKSEVLTRFVIIESRLSDLEIIPISTENIP